MDLKSVKVQLVNELVYHHQQIDVNSHFVSYELCPTVHGMVSYHLCTEGSPTT